MHKHPEDSRYYKHEVIYAAYEVSWLDMTETLGLYMAIQWARILFLFKVNYVLGPMVNILYKMFKTIVKFLFIYGMFLLIYASSGRLLFITLKEFSSNTGAIVTLFSASLANFDLKIFEDSNSQVAPRYGYMFMISYLIISNVILLNFIIAILSSIYDEVKDKSKFINLTEIIKVRNVFGYNEYYSSMISSFIPFNILLLPFMPFVIACKSKRLNKVLLHICYIPVMIIGTITFLTLSLLLLPFSYLALIYQNIRFITQKKLTMRLRLAYTCYMLMSLFKDPILLMIITVGNTVGFIKSLYSKNLKYNEENAFHKLNNLRNLDKQYFEILKKKLYKYKNSLVDIKKLISDLREELNVFNNMRSIIYESYKIEGGIKLNDPGQYSEENLSKEFSFKKGLCDPKECPAFYAIKQYNLLKKFIYYNSIPFETLTDKKVPKSRQKDGKYFK